MTSVRVTFSAARSISNRSGAKHLERLSTCVTPMLAKSFSSSSKVATTSKVTLSNFSLDHHIPTPSTLLSASRRPANSSVFFGKTRAMATITRQPEQPEDPEVFADNSDPTIIISESASNHLEKVSKRENNPDLALRISVEPGGCHGYQYKMELTNEIEPDDFRFSIKGKNVHILVDSTSLRLIKGSTIDYVTELIGSQFAIFHNPQAKGSGCGCGVSWEPNI